MRTHLTIGSLIFSSFVAACSAASPDGGNAAPGDGTGASPDAGALLTPGTPGPGGGGGGGGDGAGADGGAPAGDDAGASVRDAGSADSGVFAVGPHPAFPQLVRGKAGAGVLTAPVIVPIFFPGYDHAAQVTDELAALGTIGTYWKDTVSEYGVGAYTFHAPIRLTEAAPTSISGGQIVSWLAEKLNGTHTAEFGTPTDQWMYVIYYPKTSGVQGSCADPAQHGVGYGGYHDAVQTATGKTIAYGVIAECDNFGPTITNSLDMVTVAGSHEIIEAVTDTTPGDGYASIDQMPLDVFLQGNEENGDLCAVNHAFYRPSGSPYLLSRGWSNKAAALGNVDPCAPALSDQPFVGAAGVMPDTVTVQGSGTGPGVNIAVGASKTIDVQLWSTGPTDAFTVAAKQHRGESSLSFTWDKTKGKNGDVLKLTVKVNSAGQGRIETFAITADIDGRQTPVWAGVVKS